MPVATSSRNSRPLMPCTGTPVSVPHAIVTPAVTAAARFCAWTAAASSAFGGEAAGRSPRRACERLFANSGAQSCSNIAFVAAASVSVNALPSGRPGDN